MNPSHIVIVTHSYPRFKEDWRSNFIEALAIAYAKAGLQVTVFVPNAAKWDRPCTDPHGIRIERFNYAPSKAWHVLGYGDSLKGDLSMNIAHMVLVPFLFLAGTFKLTLLLRRENISFLHCHWAIPNTPIAVAARFLSGSRAKIFTSFPGSDVTIIRRAGWLGRILARIISRSDYLSCNSSDLKEDLVSAGIPNTRVNYEIYGVDDSKIAFDKHGRSLIRRRLGVTDDEIMLMMVGRFVAKKGFETAIRAMPSIKSCGKKVKLYIIGSGLLEHQYLDLIHTLHLEDDVVLPGEVIPSELGQYYSASDVFLMPSERFPSDGLNVVVVEAMACGRPIVASNVGGNDLVIEDGRNGYLHAAGNSGSLAEKATRLILSRELRVAMGNESLHMVRHKYNWNAIAQRYIDHYRQISTNQTIKG